MFAAAITWRTALAPYYVELGLDPTGAPPTSNRAPFGEDFCAIVEEIRPEVVSFHFGLPDEDLLKRVSATGARVISSATTVAEAVWSSSAMSMLSLRWVWKPMGIVATSLRIGWQRRLALSRWSLKLSMP